MRAAAIAAVLGLFLSPSSQGDISTLYDRQTLAQWGQRYQASTQRIMEQVIWPALLVEERRRLAGKPRLAFPLYARDAARQHPLAFYALPAQGRIVLPVFSLKFLDDLCTAYAWLQINDYTLATVSEYTALLRHSPAPAGGYPAPLTALGIPDDALQNATVDELALGHFVTARTFILLHELGHIIHRHAATDVAQSIRHERQADRFAAEVMARTGLPPLGILIFFMADAHWTHFPPRRDDTHPVTGSRVAALADHLDDPRLAQRLRALAERLDDPEIRAGMMATGKAGDFAALQPRRPGALPRSHAETGSAALFNGRYRGRLMQFAGGDTAVETVLRRNGPRVTGRYSFGLGIGALEGHIEKRQLLFQWEWAGNYGRGVLTAEGDGGFTGTWGYRNARSGAGTWSGQPVE